MTSTSTASGNARFNQRLLIPAVIVVLLILPGAILFFAGSRGSVKQNEEHFLPEILDSAKFASFTIENENFPDSCFIVEQLLRERLPEMEIPGGMSVAKDVRVLVGTYRKEKKEVQSQPGATIRQALEDFASTWEVAVLIDRNTIVFAEVFDAPRFPHEVAIMAKDAK